MITLFYVHDKDGWPFNCKIEYIRLATCKPKQIFMVQQGITEPSKSARAGAHGRTVCGIYSNTAIVLPADRMDLIGGKPNCANEKIVIIIGSDSCKHIPTTDVRNISVWLRIWVCSNISFEMYACLFKLSCKKNNIVAVKVKNVNDIFRRIFTRASMMPVQRTELKPGGKFKGRVGNIRGRLDYHLSPRREDENLGCVWVLDKWNNKKKKE